MRPLSSSNKLVITKNTNTQSSSSHRLTATTSHSTSTSTNQACAACKYQRRKCQPDCDLAPYFPADQQRTFLNAHRLFGVSNILKILRGLDPPVRPQAMRSIVFHSNARAQDPVFGCCRLILDLQHQIALHNAELELVRHQLAIYHAQEAEPQHPPLSLHHDIPDICGNPSQRLINENNVDEHDDDNNSGLIDINNFTDDTQMINNGSHDMIYFNDDHNDSITSNNHLLHQSLLHHQQFYYHSSDDNGSNNNNDTNNIIGGHDICVGEILEVPPSVMNGFGRPQRCSKDDVKPFMELFDARQPALVTAAAEADDEDSSAAKMELMMEQNSVEDVQEHDLKSAASLLTLTSCN